MGVATRGVKFKFSTGEKVLCYEPDPTKAKVLYESKVLDLVVNRDERGRKVPEYRIHFYGWNSSWDRFVREELILPYTEENRELQLKLAEDAALTIKGRRKFKLPPLIKETLNKKQCLENANEKPAQPEKMDSSSDGAPSEDEADREVKINLPETLKRQLEKDQNLITKNNKLVKLPCEPNVISILESFVKYLASKLLCASPPRNSKNGKQMMPEDVKNKLNLCKEAVDGIRVYFDFTLPYLLVYRQEMKQMQAQEFYAEIAARSPICIPAREIEQKETSHIKEESGARNSTGDLPSQNELFVKTESYTPRVGRPPRGRPCGKRKVGRRPSKTKNGSNTKSKVLLKAEKRALREILKATSTRVLRSSDKQKPPKEEPEVKPSTSSCLEHSFSVGTMETRGTRKSSQPPPNSSPRSSSCGAAEKGFAPPSSELSATTSNCITSSNSSSHSTLSDSKLDQQYHLINNAALLQDILNWRLMPTHLTKPAPSNVYGVQHLLRLFVKLPDLISKMNISTHKLQPLISILEQFLFYLAEKKDQLFLSSAYVDSCDAVTLGNSSAV